MMWIFSQDKLRKEKEDLEVSLVDAASRETKLNLDLDILNSRETKLNLDLDILISREAELNRELVSIQDQNLEQELMTTRGESSYLLTLNPKP